MAASADLIARGKSLRRPESLPAGSGSSDAETESPQPSRPIGSKTRSVAAAADGEGLDCSEICRRTRPRASVAASVSASSGTGCPRMGPDTVAPEASSTSESSSSTGRSSSESSSPTETRGAMSSATSWSNTSRLISSCEAKRAWCSPPWASSSRHALPRRAHGAQRRLRQTPVSQQTLLARGVSDAATPGPSRCCRH